jgi:hypothetical protein
MHNVRSYLDYGKFERELCFTLLYFTKSLIGFLQNATRKNCKKLFFRKGSGTTFVKESVGLIPCIILGQVPAPAYGMCTIKYKRVSVSAGWCQKVRHVDWLKLN